MRLIPGTKKQNETKQNKGMKIHTSGIEKGKGKPEMHVPDHL